MPLWAVLVAGGDEGEGGEAVGPTLLGTVFGEDAAGAALLGEACADASGERAAPAGAGSAAGAARFAAAPSCAVCAGAIGGLLGLDTERPVSPCVGAGTGLLEAAGAFGPVPLFALAGGAWAVLTRGAVAVAPWAAG